MCLAVGYHDAYKRLKPVTADHTCYQWLRFLKTVTIIICWQNLLVLYFLGIVPIKSALINIIITIWLIILLLATICSNVNNKFMK